MPSAAPTIDYAVLEKRLSEATGPKDFAEAVVNAPYTVAALQMAELFLGFICFYVVEGKAIRFKAASDNEYYHLAIKDYPKFDPNDFRLPLKDTDNDIVRAVLEQKPIHSVDWNHVKRRDAAAETVRLNQASSGIATAYSYPFKTDSEQGVLMFNYYQYADAIHEAHLDFMQRYTELVADTLVL